MLILLKKNAYPMQINFEVGIFKLKVYIANLIPMCELMIVESTTKAQVLSDKNCKGAMLNE